MVSEPDEKARLSWCSLSLHVLAEMHADSGLIWCLEEALVVSSCAWAVLQLAVAEGFWWGRRSRACLSDRSPFSLSGSRHFKKVLPAPVNSHSRSLKTIGFLAFIWSLFKRAMKTSRWLIYSSSKTVPAFLPSGTARLFYQSCKPFHHKTARWNAFLMKRWT